MLVFSFRYWRNLLEAQELSMEGIVHIICGSENENDAMDDDGDDQTKLAILNNV
jgi:hypothetical protein